MCKELFVSVLDVMPDDYKKIMLRRCFVEI